MTANPSDRNLEPNEDNLTGFGLEIVYSDDANPSRILLALSKLVQACQVAQKDLAETMPVSDIEPILIVENIEHHSILLWLKNKFSVKDANLFPIDPLKVSEFFNKSITAIVDFGGRNADITNSELDRLQKQILEIANDVNPNPNYPVYTVLPKRKYLSMLQGFQGATKDLTDQETARFVLPNKERIPFRFPIDFSEGNIEDILTFKTVENTNRKILKIKKPDYLGFSQWEFKFDKIIKAKVLDKDWIQKFHQKEFVLTPGDAIEADVKETNKFDVDLNIVSVTHEVLKVHTIHVAKILDVSELEEE